MLITVNLKGVTPAAVAPRWIIRTGTSSSRGGMGQALPLLRTAS